MKIRSGKDFWAGLMFTGFGIFFMLVALSYSMGTAGRMGPAYFPFVLGGMLTLLGGAIVLRGYVSTFEYPLKVFPFRLSMLIAALFVGGAAYFASDSLQGTPAAEFAIVGLALALFVGAFGPKSMFVVLIAVMIFGYAIQPLGLVLAIVLLIVISAFGGHDFRKKEVIILTIVLILFGVLVFVKGLGLPFNLWPGA